MKAVIWIVAIFLGALWTLMAAISASIANWFAANAGNLGGGVSNLPEQITRWPVPDWLQIFDAGLIDWLRAASIQLLETTSAVLPSVGNLLQWVAPAVWVVWGLGLACLLALAILAHFMVGRFQRPALPPPAARA